jgi:hypothetical protein
MLYRYQKYEWLCFGGKRFHEKLGDLMERQKDIQEALPQFKNTLEDY